MSCVAMLFCSLASLVFLFLYSKKQAKMFEVIDRMQRVHEEERKEWIERFTIQEQILRDYILSNRSSINEQ